MLAGCAAGSRHVATEPAPLTVREVQTLERELGFEATPNFERRASEAFEHCYYTAPLRLPEDYSGLWFKRGRDGVCLLNERKYDVFYYAPEALAGTATAVTPALERAVAGRRTFVISHEDFHDQPGIRALPAAVKEAASTLAGFLVEQEQSRRTDARRDSPAPAAIAFLEKARSINRSHAALIEIYAGYRAGAAARPLALAQKREVFARLAEDCGELPAHEAFGACPAAFNNAGLAFEATYTRLYPEVFALYEATGWDTRATLDALLEDLSALEDLTSEPRAALGELAQRLRAAR